MKRTSFIFLVVVFLPCTGLRAADEMQKQTQVLESPRKVLQEETDSNATPVVTTLTNTEAGLYEPPAGDVDAPKYIQWLKVGQIPSNSRVEILGFRNNMYAVIYADRRLWVGSSDVIENQSVIGIKQRDLEKFRAEQAQQSQARIEARQKQYRHVVAAKQAAAEERRQSLTTRFGSAVAAKIMNGNLWIGMSKGMALESIGTPDKINRTVTRARVHEQWVYGSGMYLYFEGDTVTRLQN